VTAYGQHHAAGEHTEEEEEEAVIVNVPRGTPLSLRQEDSREGAEAQSDQ
jgi:hypothetical protein